VAALVYAEWPIPTSYSNRYCLGSYVTMSLVVARLLDDVPLELSIFDRALFRQQAVFDISLFGLSGWKALLFADSRYSSRLSVALAFLLGLRIVSMFFSPRKNCCSSSRSRRLAWRACLPDSVMLEGARLDPSVQPEPETLRLHTITHSTPKRPHSR
jgi:hypothetical protein